jgi:hypothetical protein
LCITIFKAFNSFQNLHTKTHPTPTQHPPNTNFTMKLFVKSIFFDIVQLDGPFYVSDKAELPSHIQIFSGGCDVETFKPNEDVTTIYSSHGATEEERQATVDSLRERFPEIKVDVMSSDTEATLSFHSAHRVIKNVLEGNPVMLIQAGKTTINMPFQDENGKVSPGPATSATDPEGTAAALEKVLSSFTTPPVVILAGTFAFLPTWLGMDFVHDSRAIGMRTIDVLEQESRLNAGEADHLEKVKAAKAAGEKPPRGNFLAGDHFLTAKAALTVLIKAGVTEVVLGARPSKGKPPKVSLEELKARTEQDAGMIPALPEVTADAETTDAATVAI